MMRVCLKAHIGLAVVLSLAFAVGCAGTGSILSIEKADNPGPVPAGSSWVQERRDSGSFGSGTLRQTWKSLGEQTWQGRKVYAYAYDNPEGTRLSDVQSLKLVAYVKGTSPLVTYDPPVGWDYPLYVGKNQTQTYQMTLHESGQSLNFQGTFSVEAKEEIKVPAGTFKVFRIVFSSPGTNEIYWWSPELGINVKYKSVRTEEHYAGPGVRETELISYDIKR